MLKLKYISKEVEAHGRESFHSFLKIDESAPHGTKNRKNGISLLWMLLLS